MWSLKLTSKCSEHPWGHEYTPNEFSTVPALNVSLRWLDVFVFGEVGIFTLNVYTYRLLKTSPT